MAKQHKQTGDLSSQAAFWYTRLEAGSLSSKEADEFELWLTEKEDNFKAFEEIGGLSSDVYSLFTGRHTDAELDAALIETDELITSHRAHKKRRTLYRRLTSVAASIFVLLGGIWLWQSPSLFEGGAKTYKTAIGNQRTVMLSDGSVVTLNTNSEISVAMTGEVRRIHLRKGEVYFKVAKDKSRPFEVAVQNAFVKAIGTEFNIKEQAGQVSVLVTEGTVEVKSTFMPQETSTEAQLTPPLAKKETLLVGDQIIFGKEELKRSQLEESLITRKTLWREGRIILDKKSLAEVIREIQPYIVEKIVIADDDVAALIGGGVFRVGEIRAFFDALEAALPVKIIREKGIIILRRRHVENKVAPLKQAGLQAY